MRIRQLGIALVCLLGGAGSLACSSDGPTDFTNSEQTGPIKTSIDRSSYTPTDTLRMRLENSSNDVVGYTFCDLRFERYNESFQRWILATDPAEACTAVLMTLAPNGEVQVSLIFKWFLEHWPSGTYRVVLSPAFNPNSFEPIGKKIVTATFELQTP